MSRWKVFQSLSGWWACPANSCGAMDDESEHFPTHAEALAYADREARTVGVTLPRVDRATLLGVAMDFPYMAGVNMSSQEAETLALTLLTLERRKGQA